VRAIVLHGEELRLEERPDPVPGGNEVVVAAPYAALNPADLAQRAGRYPAPPGAPQDIPGLEVSGRVVARGAAVLGWQVGDRVFGLVGGGGLADRVAVHERHVVAVPERLDDLEAAAVPEAFLTAFDAMVSQAGLGPGDVLLVNGANGGVGTAAVQIGRYVGARVIAISRSDEKLELARRLGADEVVQAGGTDTVARARAACGGDGADVTIQCVGSAEVAEQAIELATFGGRVVLIGSSPEPFRARVVEICWRELTLFGSRGFTVDDIRAVVDLYLAGDIVTEHLTARTRPLAEANEALEDLREGRVLRTVLMP